jgi:hypothetical protein
MTRFALLGLLLLPIGAQAQEADWQQDVSYRITASLDEARGILAGEQWLVYRNRSPDTLRTIAFHLYLNAFRPGSRWADSDSAAGARRFNDLRDPDFGFNHVSSTRVDGVAVVPVWPFAPDSTVVRFVLPHPLAPGDSAVVTMDWDARPSTLPRRQGRRGRRFDFAQWYPRVVVYDHHGWNEHPLYPGGEFYGEFGTFLVSLEVPADQVIGATGVPLCGDPGWEAARRPAGARVTYQRNFYLEPRDPAARMIVAGAPACESPAPGRKTVVWYAEDVHHFAMSLNPDYRYEEGDIFERPVRVLYLPGDERTWGAGAAVQRTETALAWLAELFGPYPWPQITNVHRIERGGTEFPMMVMNGSAGLGLIVHEVGHSYLMGILANNEWREGWLDEGFSSFQTTWFMEALGQRGGYQRLEQQVLGWDLDGLSEVVAQPGESFSSFQAYNQMTYSRAELFYHQLRNALGGSTMHAVLREYYRRYRFRHVDEARFRQVAEEVSGRDLGPLFRQWLHETVPYDYAVRSARRMPAPDGGWRTTVAVEAKSPGLFPAEVWVFGESDSAVVRLPGAASAETVEVVTKSRPARVAVDPGVEAHDWNMLNNQRRFGLFPATRPTTSYLDTWFTQRTARDHLTRGWAPTAWYNDAAGWTVGLRVRDDYLNRFEQHELWLSWGSGWGAAEAQSQMDWRVLLKNPVRLRAPGLDAWGDVGRVEGRFRAELGVEKSYPRFRGSGPVSWGMKATWLNTLQTRYLDPAIWEDAGTFEVTASVAARFGAGPWQVALEGRSVGGTIAGRDTVSSQGFARLTASATATRPLGGRVTISARAFAGGVLAGNPVARQRQIFLAGADPYQRYDSPFLRSQGSLFVREGVNYHDPGDANLRGLGADAASRQAYALGVELEGRVFERGQQAGLFQRMGVALFSDGAFADGDADSAGHNQLTPIADAGVGLRIDHRIGQTSFQTRLDVPLWVSRPSLAQDQAPGSDPVGFRWTFSFRPSW